jgi:hypothetical protein
MARPAPSTSRHVPASCLSSTSSLPPAFHLRPSASGFCLSFSSHLHLWPPPGARLPPVAEAVPLLHHLHHHRRRRPPTVLRNTSILVGTIPNRQPRPRAPSVLIYCLARRRRHRYRLVPSILPQLRHHLAPPPRATCIVPGSATTPAPPPPPPLCPLCQV